MATGEEQFSPSQESEEIGEVEDCVPNDPVFGEKKLNIRPYKKLILFIYCFLFLEGPTKTAEILRGKDDIKCQIILKHTIMEILQRVKLNSTVVSL